jgi:hypothetical protein
MPPVIRAHIANQQNPAPPPSINQAMDPNLQQFLAAQMQLIQKPHQHCAANASSTEPATTADSSATSATQGQAQGVHESPSSYVFSLV